MARKYARDNRGRFASGGGGATARGGRLKTASGKKRATQTASLKSPGFRSGTIAKGGRGVSGSVARSLAATKRGRAGATPAPAAPAARAGSSGRVTYRTRAQAAARQRERARMVLDRVDKTRNSIRSTSNLQGNLLTGRAERVVARRAVVEGSVLGRSKAYDRGVRRSRKIGERLLDLNNQRNNLLATTPIDRLKKRSNPEYKKLFKIQKSMETQRRADDYYSANPRAMGRRAGRRR